MSTYGSRVNNDWVPSPLWKRSYLETSGLHPILHRRQISQQPECDYSQSYAKFKHTQLPRGGTEDYLDFEPVRVPIHKPKNSKTTEEQLKDEAVKQFKTKEKQLTNGLFKEKSEEEGDSDS